MSDVYAVSIHFKIFLLTPVTLRIWLQIHEFAGTAELL